MGEKEAVNRLTKAQILEGTDQVFYEHFAALNGEVALVPLSDGQYAQVEAIRSGGAEMVGTPVMTPEGDVDRAKSSENLQFKIDMQKATEHDHEADVLAVAYSLSGGTGEQWTDRDVKSIRPPGVVKAIAAKVYEISGVQQQQIEQVRSFRGKSGGSADNKPADGRRAAGKKTK